MKDKDVLFIVHAAAIAAIYVVLTVVGASFSFGAMQVRISEALTVLPYFTPAAIPGLFVGCLIANLTAGAVPLDIIFGSVATLLGAVGSRALRRNKFLVPIPPVIANAVIVPFVLSYGYGDPTPIPLMMLSVGAGEVVSCYVLGLIVLFALDKYKTVIFRTA